ncbi:hypothetical protein M5K25_019571 [Dendrobium thyrsiflorum]|uniref:Uncharacterized protein n=1 Tax=Dendrobium thyrsiflorum TaxID=117978 RepID=A0ABD0UFR1_DENTH
MHCETADREGSRFIHHAGDRVDSALKDMAMVMTQQDRAEEAIEAIKSFRHLCSKQAQEFLDNLFIDIYKVFGDIYWLFRCPDSCAKLVSSREKNKLCSIERLLSNVNQLMGSNFGHLRDKHK